MKKTLNMNKNSFIDNYRISKDNADKAVQKHIDSIAPRVPLNLIRAMKYAVNSGGKRVRPVLLEWTAELGNPNDEILTSAMTAIEYIHSYSLIHDDLPSMDDDDFRRGKKTVHVKFGEAIAILAGDALLTESFSLLADTGDCRLVKVLAECSGAMGMVAGQAEDIQATADIEYINELKTARLFQAAAVMGAIVGGLSDKDVDKMSDYGINIGRAFQLKDDIMDNEASELAKVKKQAGLYNKKAKEMLRTFDKKEKLEELADFIIERKK
ncbi:MAG: polyprenyl synthetase family protein [Elusimicrobiota bacterium]